MRQRHSFGQIFLKNQKYIQKILASFDLSGKTVLEIGPGKGLITSSLINQAKYLYCVEVDRRFCVFLKNKFRHNKNVEIIHADILKFPFSKLGENITIFGNIPYHISSQLIRYLVNHRKYIKAAYLTFQKEFVQKLTARPSTCNYNFLSCYSQYYANIKKLFDIPASAFEPAPKVDSSFSEITFYSKPPYQVDNEDFLFKIIRKAFAGRRKKIINSLPIIPKGTGAPVKDKRSFFSLLKVDPNSRAENISLKEYVSIANNVASGTHPM